MNIFANIYSQSVSKTKCFAFVNFYKVYEEGLDSISHFIYSNKIRTTIYKEGL
jgi:hypothetical protein